MTRTARSILAAAVLYILVAAPGMLRADEKHPLTAAQREKIEMKWTAELEAAEQTVEKTPDDVNAYSRRGDAHFFLGHFAEAVADYDKMAELDADHDASHWRRGIAWFYAENYDEAAGQFERYHSFDDVDRENGIWRYLSQHKAKGQKTARQGLLKYKKDDREPFPSVYRLFAGEIEPQEILDAIDKAEISDVEREKRLFYAELYIGLNAAVEDEPDVVLTHLHQAVKNTWAPTAGYGPHYMWQVGRLHYELLSREKK
ncbi:MAG: hypothetical protein WD065_10920 [Planctomycetaceae bacterium]